MHLISTYLVPIPASHRVLRSAIVNRGCPRAYFRRNIHSVTSSRPRRHLIVSSCRNVRPLHLFPWVLMHSVLMTPLLPRASVFVDPILEVLRTLVHSNGVTCSLTVVPRSSHVQNPSISQAQVR